MEDPKHKKVKLGSLMLGQKVKKQVVVVNNSRTELSFTLLLQSDTPLDPKVGTPPPPPTHTHTHNKMVKYRQHVYLLLFLSSLRICRSVQQRN